MSDFSKACEDNEVMYTLYLLLRIRMGGFIDAVGKQDVSSSETADALFQQASMEVANKKNGNLGNVNVLGEHAVQEASKAPAANDDILSRLNNL